MFFVYLPILISLQYLKNAQYIDNATIYMKHASVPSAMEKIDTK